MWATFWHLSHSTNSEGGFFLRFCLCHLLGILGLQLPSTSATINLYNTLHIACATHEATTIKYPIGIYESQPESVKCMNCSFLLLTYSLIMDDEISVVLGFPIVQIEHSSTKCSKALQHFHGNVPFTIWFRSK